MTTLTTDSIKNSPEQVEAPKRILFANSKGGCGKSTLATNLASYYARNGVATALLDYDPQGSASQWLKRRDPKAPPITGIEAHKVGNTSGTSNWFMRLPRETRRIIADTPAGLQGQELAEQIRLADLIIVPVLPSPIDIHTATRFIGSILLSGQFRKSNKQLLVLANRAKKHTRALRKLDLFLSSLKLPRTGNMRDTQNYIYCSDLGLGIADLPLSRGGQDLQEWHELVEWLEQQLHGEQCAPVSTNNEQTEQETPPSPESREGVYTVV